MTADASRNVIDLYERHAGAFDRSRSRGLMEKTWLDRFLGLLPKSASILDIGCGSGEPIARYCIENGFDVTGIDASSSLIALCRQRFAQGRWILGDIRDMALEQRFDGLIAWHSLFHLKPEDQRRMFGVFQAHAKDDAVLMFTAGPEEGEAIADFQGDPLYHASLSFETYEALLAQAGFGIVSHHVNDETCGGATVYLAQKGGGVGVSELFRAGDAP